MVMTKRIFLYLLFVFSLSLALLGISPLASAAAEDNTKTDKNGQVINPLGVKSPATDLWRAVRQRNQSISGKTQVRSPNAGTLINVSGQAWRDWRVSKLIPYSMYAVGGMLALIVLFRLIRGKIKIKAGRSGKKIKRFTSLQRFVHWAVAILFVILGLTGLIMSVGRYALLPLIGKEAFGTIASTGKLLHDYLGPVFAIMLLVMLLTFIKGNFFNWTDIKWFLKGGGLLGGHVSAGRYNGGEKLWFWAAILVGSVVVASGLILDFPAVAAQLNLARADIELSQIVHAVAATGLLVVSFGHIYMGTFAMEGAFEAMQTGECDENWAKEHHDLWYEDVKNQATPDDNAQKSGPSTNNSDIAAAAQ